MLETPKQQLGNSIRTFRDPSFLGPFFKTDPITVTSRQTNCELSVETKSVLGQIRPLEWVTEYMYNIHRTGHSIHMYFCADNVKDLQKIH